jgi:indole-3-glycerol phosphate synthase
MTDFLQNMATLSAARAAAAPATFTSTDFDKPLAALKPERFGIIAEIKRRSPSEGPLNYGDSDLNSDLKSRARAYSAGGAAAISVLTEPSRFDGKLEHLAAVAAAVPGTPVMRKDFLVDPVQVLEARKAGASGVLLIATMLSDALLRRMLDCAWEHGMFVLLEAFDEDDLRRSSALLDAPGDRDKADAGQLLIGVNTRNLRTLAVDAGRLQTLATKLPQATCVAESGLTVADDAARVARWGYRMALVGTALMRSDDPAALIAAMRAAGAAA